MWQYTIRRLILGAFTGLLVSLMIFAVMRIAPGDVALTILGTEEGATWTEEDYLELRAELGLDRPLHIQYVTWIADIVTLDWGTSLRDGTDIFGEIKKKVPVTLELVIMTVTLGTLIGIPFGIIMALKQDTWIDYSIRIFSLAGLSIPSFWSATMILVMGLIFFNWGPRLEYVSIFEDPQGNMAMFIWPALALGWLSSATRARMMRSSMLEVLRQDYIRTAHAKGLRGYMVVYRHALKNAMLPVITIIGISIALTMGGSVIIETIFQLPGMGKYLIEGMRFRDHTVVQTVVLLFALWVVVINLLVDLTYGLLDPRIRFD